MGTASSVTDAIGILLLIITFICGILLGYSGCEFFKFRENILIKKRYGNVVLIINFSLLLYIVINSGIFIILARYPFTFIDIYKNNQLLMDVLYALTAQIFGYSMMGLIAIRYWIIYFDFKFFASNTNMTNEWQTYLKHTVSDLSATNWYIMHRSDYGNLMYLIKRLFIFYLIIQIGEIIEKTTVLITHQNNPFSTIFEVILFLWFMFNLIFIMIIWKKMPKFDDDIFIYHEMKRVIFVWISFFVWYLFFAFILSPLFGKTRHFVLLYWINNFFGILTPFLSAFISTFWVLFKLKKTNKINVIKDINLHFIETNILRACSQSIDIDVKLKDVLHDESGYCLFMEHLHKELCMEALLGFTEMIQFKNYCMDIFNIDTTQKSDAPYHHIKLPQNVPLSAIIYDSDNNNNNNVDETEYKTDDKQLITECKKKIQLLYKKYIREGSEFELNISYRDKTNITDKLERTIINNNNTDCWTEDDDPNKLYILLDDVIDSMYLLMNTSFTRFKETPHFKKFIATYYVNK